jgi:chromosome segregation ATPase
VVTALLDNSLVASNDRATLQAFVQSQSSTEDGFESMQAPAAAAYGTHSGSDAVLATFQNLEVKAEAQRSDSSKAETEAQFNFEMLKQSLTDELKTQNKELATARNNLAANQEALATANGDLTETNKDAQADSASLSQLQTNCMQTASDHEVSVRDRADELKALAEARRVIVEATGGASGKAYGLVQIGASTRVVGSGVDSVVLSLRELGQRSNDLSVSLLASKISSVAVAGDDVFAKVKGLIRDMISQLSEKARADAKEHEWCTTKTKETEAKKSDHAAVVDKLTSKSDRAKATIARTQEEIATLEAELGQLSRMQADMDQERAKQHAENVETASDYQKGVEGVQAAIKVLKSYYSKDSTLLQQPTVGKHSASGDAGSGIIGLLEVCESDFSKLLAETEADEEAAEKDYVKQTKANKLTKAEKETALKYSGKTLARTEKSLSELTDDTEAEQAELDATLEYLAKVNKRCVAKPETYEDRKGKRDSEIEGLKKALKVLEEETASSFLAVRSVALRQ